MNINSLCFLLLAKLCIGSNGVFQQNDKHQLEDSNDANIEDDYFLIPNLQSNINLKNPYRSELSSITSNSDDYNESFDPSHNTIKKFKRKSKRTRDKSQHNGDNVINLKKDKKLLRHINKMVLKRYLYPFSERIPEEYLKRFRESIDKLPSNKQYNNNNNDKYTDFAQYNLHDNNQYGSRYNERLSRLMHRPNYKDHYLQPSFTHSLTPYDYLNIYNRSRINVNDLNEEVNYPTKQEFAPEEFNYKTLKKHLHEPLNENYHLPQCPAIDISYQTEINNNNIDIINENSMNGISNPYPYHDHSHYQQLNKVSNFQQQNNKINSILRKKRDEKRNHKINLKTFKLNFSDINDDDNNNVSKLKMDKNDNLKIKLSGYNNDQCTAESGAVTTPECSTKAAAECSTTAAAECSTTAATECSTMPAAETTTKCTISTTKCTISTTKCAISTTKCAITTTKCASNFTTKCVIVSSVDDPDLVNMKTKPENKKNNETGLVLDENDGILIDLSNYITNSLNSNDKQLYNGNNRKKKSQKLIAVPHIKTNEDDDDDDDDEFNILKVVPHLIKHRSNDIVINSYD